MTTGMAIPRVKLQNTNPLTLDERMAYGNIPRWIAEGVEIRAVNIPQANYAKQLRMLPPLHSGHGSGIVKYGAAPRQESYVRPVPLRSPWKGEVGEGLTAYVSKSQNAAMDGNSPYITYASYQMSPQNRRSWRENYYNQHAKQGFKFWLEEKQPISRSQKYTFGTYKTHLGLGNAPRN
ncbi:uncharacterized protein LOC129264583 [Lytechinus pictus]|uniref:uncharacterized protein LOC121418610 n=1 Tax=Lytechinus variegatus TaxID=7654 RepID=UPI001BB0EBB7|nr:uncharacterized protein LOC121418610 [Lytechinus variegatus]XP_054758459.1 uncharacterized protein LOC129264583 [Lytechinus pictus]